MKPEQESTTISPSSSRNQQEPAIRSMAIEQPTPPAAITASTEKTSSRHSLLKRIMNYLFEKSPSAVADKTYTAPQKRSPSKAHYRNRQRPPHHKNRHPKRGFSQHHRDSDSSQHQRKNQELHNYHQPQMQQQELNTEKPRHPAQKIEHTKHQPAASVTSEVNTAPPVAAPVKSLPFVETGSSPLAPSTQPMHTSPLPEDATMDNSSSPAKPWSNEASDRKSRHPAKHRRHKRFNKHRHVKNRPGHNPHRERLEGEDIYNKKSNTEES